MKRFAIIIIFFCLLIILIFSGRTKEQRPKFKVAEAYYNRGLTYFDKGQYDLAISNFSRAIEIDPEHVASYSNRGEVYKLKGQYDKAISDFSIVIETNPKLSVFYYIRGNTYFEKKDYANTRNDYNKAQELGFVISPKVLEKLREASTREKWFFYRDNYDIDILNHVRYRPNKFESRALLSGLARMLHFFNWPKRGFYVDPYIQS